LTAQYGIGTSDPLRKALDIEYDPKTGIKPYFDNIKRYAGLAGLNQKNTLYILKQNLPNNIKDFILLIATASFITLFRKQRRI